MSLDLSYEELDGYINQISTGQKLVEVENKLGENKPLLFKYPTHKNQIVADLIYKKSFSEAKSMGIPTLAEVEELVKTRGIFTEEHEEEIKRLKSKIKGQEAVLAKTTRVPARRDRIKDAINKLQSEINKIQLRKEIQLENSCERKASEAKFLYLVRQNVFNVFTEELYWPSEEAFNSEPDFAFRRAVFVEYIVFSHGLKQDYLRYIARSNLWRIRYVTALKTNDSLFGVPIRDYNVDQLMLLYWSHYYQSINEMMPDERPSDEIVEDDQALDAYMKDWHADRSREATASKAKKNKKYGQNSAWDYGETLVMKSNPLHEDINYSETLNERGYQKGAVVDAAPVHRSKSKKGKG